MLVAKAWSCASGLTANRQRERESVRVQNWRWRDIPLPSNQSFLEVTNANLSSYNTQQWKPDSCSLESLMLALQVFAAYPTPLVVESLTVNFGGVVLELMVGDISHTCREGAATRTLVCLSNEILFGTIARASRTRRMTASSPRLLAAVAGRLGGASSPPSPPAGACSGSTGAATRTLFEGAFPQSSTGFGGDPLGGTALTKISCRAWQYQLHTSSTFRPPARLSTPACYSGGTTECVVRGYPERK